MDIIASGSPRAKFTLTPRHEVQRLGALAPMPPRAVIASFRGGGLSGAYGASDDGFPVFPLVVYGVIAGLILGTVHARRRG